MFQIGRMSPRKKRPTPEQLLAEVKGKEAARTYEFEDYLEVVHELVQKEHRHSIVRARGSSRPRETPMRSGWGSSDINLTGQLALCRFPRQRRRQPNSVRTARASSRRLGTGPRGSGTPRRACRSRRMWPVKLRDRLRLEPANEAFHRPIWMRALRRFDVGSRDEERAPWDEDLDQGCFDRTKLCTL